MNRYTFVVDFHGGIYMSQHWAKSVDNAIAAWSKSKKENGFSKATKLNAQQQLNLIAEEADVVAVAGLKDVWCCSFWNVLLNDIILVNIIKQ